MGLKHTYTLWAPIYDFFIARTFSPLRRRSLENLPSIAGKKILLSGVGTGLDFPYLSPGASYVGVDITPAMLRKAETRKGDLDITLVEGDSMLLPFEKESFDHVVLHLILAVVPQPKLALSEALRVVKPGGHIVVLDKFLKPGEYAPLRRLINPVISRLATRTDVVLEHIVDDFRDCQILYDRPALLGGWFRFVGLQKVAFESEGTGKR